MRLAGGRAGCAPARNHKICGGGGGGGGGGGLVVMWGLGGGQLIHARDRYNATAIHHAADNGASPLARGRPAAGAGESTGTRTRNRGGGVVGADADSWRRRRH